ncbi:1-acyl-sn-glycerol-3-phosphate acyltransferase [Desulfovibrio sp. OttesenSCG-928-F07]|nr:1-acyl-sn-glycerol-3-phosphate acyltransferase [Desulfovibrio sp. OttesenSCG-928-F07]
MVQSWPFKKLFFFAPIMRKAGYIEAGAPENADLITKCSEIFKSGASIFYFPEGTRTRTGKLQPFYAGMFRVAVSCNVPVVPVVFHNTRDICPAGTFAANPQELRISVLEPIYPESVAGEPKPHLRLRDKAHAAISASLDSKK